MVVNSRALHLCGASALAISAGLLAMPIKVNACTATATVTGETISAVDVVCKTGEAPVLPFFTSFSLPNPDGPLQLYNGAGNDTLTMDGGSIVATGTATPSLDQGINLDPSTGIVEMLGGDDFVRITDGTVGDDTPIGLSLGVGDDRFEMLGGTITGSVFGLAGADTYVMSGGIIVGSIFGNDGNDNVTISDTANIQHDASIGPDAVGLENGDDVFLMTGGALGGSVSGGAGDDLLTISGGGIDSFLAGNGGTDQIFISGGFITGDVLGGSDGEGGGDEITVSGGTVGGSVSGDAGDDLLTISGGTIGSSVAGDGGADQIFISGGAIAGDVLGGSDGDEITVSDGSIAGNVDAETVNLHGGTIGGDILGISGDTLLINDSLSPAALSLRNGVVISGTNAVGFITNTDLAAGGTQTQVFTGFDSVTLNNSTLGFGSGPVGIGLLSLGNGSTLFVNGNVNMPGVLNVTGSTISMVDGVADDIFTLGGLNLNNGRIALDLNQQTIQADQLVVGSFAATGVNAIAVNLIGAPQFSGPTDIPIILTDGPVAGTFVIEGIPGTPGALFTFQVVAGPGGGLFIRATPANFGVVAAPISAINASTVDTAIEALYGINDDAIDADLGLANGAQRMMISPSFGVFASGQFAHTDHDGFKITSNNVTGSGPGFDADDFSAAISVDFNAAKHFGFDDKYGLNLGVFAGYASTDVGMGVFQSFPQIGDADNASGMFGAYGLFRQGSNYALISMSAFLGETDVTNSVLNTTGSYDTEGYAFTGSVGHIFALTDRIRFDLRGGLLGVTFTGDSYTDSGGNQFGESKISFGAFKFEPGVYADYLLENGMVFSPYARADLQQRFSYENTASVDGQEIDFDDADFSAALSTGFNLKATAATTFSGEIRGKVSADASSLGGKLGLKIAF